MKWIHDLTLISAVILLLASHQELCGSPFQDSSVSSTSGPKVVIREIESPVDHNHITTRQFQNMVLRHGDVWFVFYSDGAHFRYQTWDITEKEWKRPEEPIDGAPNGSSGFDLLNIGDLIYLVHPVYPLGRYDVTAPYAIDPSRRNEYKIEGRLKKGLIEGKTIHLIDDQQLDFAPGYTRLLSDSSGHLWVFSREPQYVKAYQAAEPAKTDRLLPETVPIPLEGRHALDAVALNDRKIYAASILTDKGTLYGNLYNGRQWANTPTLIDDQVTKVAGDDRRLALAFDQKRKQLQLIYIDSSGVLRHRSLGSPYDPGDWDPPLGSKGRHLASRIFTCALSMDSSGTDTSLIITYGVEKYVDQDPRFRTGEIFVRRFAKSKWKGQGILVSQPGTIYNWYPNVNRDTTDGLCVLYSRSLNDNKIDEPLAVMVSLVEEF